MSQGGSMANLELRRLAKAEGIPLWRIAEVLKISEPTMTRKLRRELSDEEKVEVSEIIQRLKGGDKQ